jgi:hypothetical protein
LFQEFIKNIVQAVYVFQAICIYFENSFRSVMWISKINTENAYIDAHCGYFCYIFVILPEAKFDKKIYFRGWLAEAWCPLGTLLWGDPPSSPLSVLDVGYTHVRGKSPKTPKIVWLFRSKGIFD